MSLLTPDPALWAIFYHSPWRLETYWAAWLRTDVATLRQGVIRGELQAVTFEGKVYLPRYSFHQGQAHPAMAALLAQGGRAGWALARWFITPHAALGETPLMCWEQDPEAVVAAWAADVRRSAA